MLSALDNYNVIVIRHVQKNEQTGDTEYILRLVLPTIGSTYDYNFISHYNKEMELLLSKNKYVVTREELELLKFELISRRDYIKMNGQNSYVFPDAVSLRLYFQNVLMPAIKKYAHKFNGFE